jgi:hypothetical protein
LKEIAIEIVVFYTELFFRQQNVKDILTIPNPQSWCKDPFGAWRNRKDQRNIGLKLHGSIFKNPNTGSETWPI